jgi:hypothetical protein
MRAQCDRVRRGLWRSQFEWLWASYAVSTFGTWLAFDALPIVRRKRRVMIVMDCLRFVALASVPAAYALGVLQFGQLVAAAVVVGAADICFRAASGACLKALVPRDFLLTTNTRFESTTWTATMVGPPLGGGRCAVFNPVAATYRLEHTPDGCVANALAAWTITTKLTVAGLTAAWGLLAESLGLRVAIGLAGVLMLVTPVLLRELADVSAVAQPGAALEVA